MEKVGDFKALYSTLFRSHSFTSQSTDTWFPLFSEKVSIDLIVYLYSNITLT